MDRIPPSNDKERKGRSMVSERFYIAISIVLTGVVVYVLMTAFSVTA